MINIDQVKELRQQTGVPISECKTALEEANGNNEKAKEILKTALRSYMIIPCIRYYIFSM